MSLEEVFDLYFEVDLVVRIVESHEIKLRVLSLFSLSVCPPSSYISGNRMKF